jgi:hypothetical protein
MVQCNQIEKEFDMQRPLETDEKGRPTKEWLGWAYYEQKLGLRDIATMTGRSQSGIQYIMTRRHGMDLRHPEHRVDREWLEQKYAVEKLPIKAIAELAGVEYDHISYLVRTRYEIPLNRPIQRQFQPSREWVWQKYIVEDLSAKQICELTGYSKSGFVHLLNAYGIESKVKPRPKLEISEEELYELHVVRGLTAVRIAQKYGCNHSAISRRIQKYNLDPGRPLVNHKAVPPLTRDELWKLYWVDQKSTGDIASLYNVGKSTAQRWFTMLDVPTRKWNGGEVNRVYTRNSTDPSKRLGREFNAIERNKILDRDGWQCKMPGCHCKEAWLLEVHHILPIEAGGDNALDNGITLCNKCHDSIRKRELEFLPIFRPLVNPNQ